MTASVPMSEALNEQINLEFFSSYQYLAMAAYCQARSLSGFANWFIKQAEEEREHGMKIFNYLFDRNKTAKLKALKEPVAEFDSVQAAFEAALRHEEHVTDSINKLVALASEEKDYATVNFLRWFIEEQVEEEAAARTIVERLRLIKDSGAALLYLDKELGKR